MTQDGWVEGGQNLWTRPQKEEFSTMWLIHELPKQGCNASKDHS